MTSDERREPTIDELSEMVSKIIGTELVTIAKNAPSPRQAALLASHFGYNKDMIQATRWAAIIIRGERSSANLNRKFVDIIPPGVYSGLTVAVDGTIAPRCVDDRRRCPDRRGCPGISLAAGRGRHIQP